MIGTRERTKLFGCFAVDEDARRVVDADQLVGRRMEYEQRLVQMRDAVHQHLLGDVVEEFAATVNGRPASVTSASPLSRIVPTCSLNRPATCAGSDGAAIVTTQRDSGDAMRGGQHRGAAEAVADQDRRRAMRLAQMIGGGDEIVDIGREMRVGEFALAAAESGEVEAQHGDPDHRQPLGDALGGEIVLAAGEAVREQREGRRLADRPVEQRRELVAAGLGNSKRSVRMVSSPVPYLAQNPHMPPGNRA